MSSDSRARLRSIEKRSDLQPPDLVQKGKTKTIFESRSAKKPGGTELKVIEPPISLTTLDELYKRSGELSQVIEAVVTNVCGFGHTIKLRDSKKEDLSEFQDEVDRLQNLLRYVNADQNFDQLIEDVERNLERTGNAFVEVLVDFRGRPTGLVCLPAPTIKLTPQEDTKTRTHFRRIWQQGDEFKVRSRIDTKRFRKFVQHSDKLGPTGEKRVRYYKEFQDRREYDRFTGELLATKQDIQLARQEDRLAHAIIHIKLGSDTYGQPNHVSAIHAIRGEEQAARVNLTLLNNNNIPSMFIVCEGGQLTDDTIDRLADMIDSKVNKKDNRTEIILLEAEPTITQDPEEAKAPKLRVEQLRESQVTDSMFKNFVTDMRHTIRRTHRLPELLVGYGTAKTRAEIEANMRFADEQVFAPKRRKLIQWFNSRILPEMGIANIVLELNTPNLTDVTTLIQLMAGLEKTGAMTPRIGRMIGELIFGKPLPPFEDDFEEEAADRPFTLTMVEHQKQSSIEDTGINNADPTEPSQQFMSMPQSSGELLPEDPSHKKRDKSEA